MQDYNQASILLGNFGSYLEKWRGLPVQVEHIRIFYLSLQTWFGIASGKVCIQVATLLIYCLISGNFHTHFYLYIFLSTYGSPSNNMVLGKLKCYSRVILV